VRARQARAWQLSATSGDAALDAARENEQALAGVWKPQLVGRKFRQEGSAQRIHDTKIACEILPHAIHDEPQSFVTEALLNELSVLGNLVKAEWNPDTPQAPLPRGPSMNEVHQARDDEVRVAVLWDHRGSRMLMPISFHAFARAQG
jgi:hypothetical protein